MVHRPEKSGLVCAIALMAKSATAVAVIASVFGLMPVY
jgi:hypothetical protein